MNIMYLHHPRSSADTMRERNSSHCKSRFLHNLSLRTASLRFFEMVMVSTKSTPVSLRRQEERVFAVIEGLVVICHAQFLPMMPYKGGNN